MDHAVRLVETTETGASVTVVDKGRLPMPVLMTVTYTSGETVTKRVGVEPWLNGRRTVTVTLPQSSVSRVELDPQHVLPDLYRSNNVWTASDAIGDANRPSTP